LKENFVPEFILDLGNATDSFSKLDEFTQGYVEAMFFTSIDTDEDLFLASYDEIAPMTLYALVADCESFQNDNFQCLALAYDTGYTKENAGRDYWYTRNGHGVGFWDRDLGWLGERLTNVSEHLEINLYRGDDGQLYLM